MNKRLLFQTLTKFLLGFVIIWFLLFLPAGSISYWQGWLLMGILFIPMFLVGLFLLVKNPELLKKRLNTKEKEREQKKNVTISALLFVVAFVIAGLNWRFNWILLPNVYVWSVSIIFILSYILYAEVMKENTYLSRVVEVQINQKVVDTGMYGIVRHPMYLATTILFLSMPLVLSSPLSFVIMLGYIPIIVKRIKNEEKILEQGLDGYSDYKKRVKYRMIPYVW